jgi:5'(3')-deoxyribonucleotidase
MKNENYGIIYCDMDGVLVDFLKGAEHALGHPFEAPTRDAKEKEMRKNHIENIPHFWQTLPEMAGAQSLWSKIDKYEAHILTAYAEWDRNSKAGKEIWVKKHLGLTDMSRFNAVLRHQKQDYAVSKNGKPNILIDDYIKNIKEFEAAGGVGIHHVSAKVTILKLKQLGFR